MGTEINEKLDSIATSLRGICILFIVFVAFWIPLQFVGMNGSEKACFYRKTIQRQVKVCLSSNRPAVDCLAEARALCLKDLADE